MRRGRGPDWQLETGRKWGGGAVRDSNATLGGVGGSHMRYVEQQSSFPGLLAAHSHSC